MHEASLYDANAFVTLTYDDANLPPGGSLAYSDFRSFMKRFRRSRWYLDSEGRQVKPQSRYFMCGEYGAEKDRPHFHAILFDCSFPDMQPLRRLSSDRSLYRSASLERLWPKGLSSIGMVSYESAAYVAQYCVKKVNGPRAADHYMRFDESGNPYWLTPEFAHMSLKPGIGARWFEQFGRAAASRDFVYVQGREVPMPRYYDKLFAKADAYGSDDIKQERALAAASNRFENGPERLAVREQVARSRIPQRKL